MSPPRLLRAGFLVVAVLLSLMYFFGQRHKLDDTGVAAIIPINIGVQSTEATASTPAEFPVADLRAALTDVCSGDVAKSADKEWTEEEIHAYAHALNEKKQGLSKRLSISSSAEHLYLAALLVGDPTSRFELLDKAISRGPSEPLLVWGAVQLCSDANEEMPCPLRDWEQLLVAVDGQNSESWIRVAANRYAANEYDAALEAIRYASTAAESRDYWTETIEMVERGLAAGSDYPFVERVSMAFGVAASELPRYGDYVRMCEERSSQSVDWAYACVAYGELVENQGKTNMGVSIARAIQRLALESLGEVDRAAEVQQRLDARRREKLASINDHDPTIEWLISSNPAVFSAYLAAIQSDGEDSARRQIRVEIERLLEQQPELACEQTRVR